MIFLKYETHKKVWDAHVLDVNLIKHVWVITERLIIERNPQPRCNLQKKILLWRNLSGTIYLKSRRESSQEYAEPTLSTYNNEKRTHTVLRFRKKR